MTTALQYAHGPKHKLDSHWFDRQHAVLRTRRPFTLTRRIMVRWARAVESESALVQSREIADDLAWQIVANDSSMQQSAGPEKIGVSTTNREPHS